MSKVKDFIFSKVHMHNHVVFTIFGIKIKLLSIKNHIKRVENYFNFCNQAIFELSQTVIAERAEKREFDVSNILSKIKNPPNYLPVDSRHNYLNLLLGCDEFFCTKNQYNSDRAVINWEIRPTPENTEILYHAIANNKDIAFIGDSFLRSIDTFVNDKALPLYRRGISFTIDDLTSYFDATRPSRLEKLLNDQTLVVSDEQKLRAGKCIEKIVANHLTKYNHQPIFDPEIGRKGVKKVLVVDQTYGDMSIAKGWGSEETFKEMLAAAVKENPDADIIVKTHPDTMTGNRGGYYTGLKPHDNIYTQTEPINPISLIKSVDKVYVCTTQFGFEALMCGKEVHVFGMPFYAGWGLTHDRQKCERRTNTRTLEEIFYIAYIIYSHYVNPDKKCRCEIEEAIDYLLELREKYNSDR